VPPLMLKRLNRFIVSTKSSAYTEQDMLKQCGAVFWATDGVSASTACGEVWVTYTLEMYNEQPSTSVSGYLSGTPNVAGGQASPNFNSGSYANLGLLPIVNGSIVPMPSGYSGYLNSTFILQKGGSYMFTLIWLGTGIVGGDSWVSIDKDGDTNATYTPLSQVINASASGLITIFRFDSLNTTVVEPYAQLGNPLYVVCSVYPTCTTMTNLRVFVTPMGVAGSGDIGLISGNRLSSAEQKRLYATEHGIVVKRTLAENDELLTVDPTATPKGHYVFVEEPLVSSNKTLK